MVVLHHQTLKHIRRFVWANDYNSPTWKYLKSLGPFYSQLKLRTSVLHDIKNMGVYWSSGKVYHCKSKESQYPKISFSTVGKVRYISRDCVPQFSHGGVIPFHTQVVLHVPTASETSTNGHCITATVVTSILPAMKTAQLVGRLIDSQMRAEMGIMRHPFQKHFPFWDQDLMQNMLMQRKQRWEFEQKKMSKQNIYPTFIRPPFSGEPCSVSHIQKVDFDFEAQCFWFRLCHSSASIIDETTL